MVSHNLIRHTELGDFDLNKPLLNRSDLPNLRELLLADKRRPLERRGLLCNGICMRAGHREWMSVYENHKGLLIGRHQTRAGEDRHKSVISPQHLAYQERTAVEAELGGFPSELEAWSADRTIRTDTLVRGAVLLGVEIQRSDFAAGTVRKRADLAESLGILPAWHTDQSDIAKKNEVAWTRTDNLPVEAIRHGRDLLVRGGIQDIEPERCDKRALFPCPIRGGGRCDGWHIHPQPRPTQYGDFIRGAASGLLVPFVRRQGRNTVRTWVDADQLSRFEDLIGGPSAGAPSEPEGKHRGRSSSSSHYDPSCLERIGRQLEPPRERIVLVPRCVLCGQPTRCVDRDGLPRCFGCPTPEGSRPTSDSAETRPTDGSCSHWIGAELRYCREAEGVRRYQQGYRCTRHDIRTLAGLPPLPDSPGIPAYRTGVQG